MNNTWVIRIVSVLVVALVGLWLVSATEWADTEVPTPASGEAKKNRFYGAQAMLRELGMKVVKRESLDTMPPAQAPRRTDTPTAITSFFMEGSWKDGWFLKFSVETANSSEARSA